MKKEEFEVIKTNLENRVELCRKYLDNVVSKEDLLNLSVKEILELRDFCRKESAEMTQICMVDLYHVIGMGNLTLVQQNTFLKLFREYTTYRSDLKCLSTHLSNIDDIPDIPTKSKFKLLQLGNVTLYSGRSGETTVEIEETIEDYKEARKETKNLQSTSCETAEGLQKISRVGDVVTFPATEVDLFMTLCGHGGKRDTLLSKARNHGNYLGLLWSLTENGYLQGIIRTDGARSNLTSRGLVSK